MEIIKALVVSKRPMRAAQIATAINKPQRKNTEDRNPVDRRHAL